MPSSRRPRPTSGRLPGGLAALALAALAPAASGCGPSLAVSEQAANYFNLHDGASFTYEAETGLSETHEYSRAADPDPDDREIFERVARRGGFLEDDGTFTLAVTDDRQVLITRYYDCVTRCGDLSEPVVMFDTWPLEGGQVAETDTLVTLTRNGDPDGTRLESHRFQVGAPSALDIAAGAFEEAFTVVWTRTIEGDSDSSTFTVAPEAGFVVIEPFGGARMELVELPATEDDEP